ncbi:MAG: Hsp20/alpha crystallin family protein [Candidatus Thiodiazotropha sp. (ex Codakia rugifera)]|nr:Hsp20/alpha crystallin family protein [Candidatus Thiodiazotropha sp. (ex Codakia rugifera)]
MIKRNRKPLKRAIILGMALLLASGLLMAQAPSVPYQQWHAYPLYHPYYGPNPADMIRNLNLLQEQLYRQLQFYTFHGPKYFGAIPSWGGNFKGTASHLQDRGDHYLVQMRLPGVTSNDIDMRLDGQVLTISVQTKDDQVNTGQWQTFFGNLQQVFTLPEAVDSSRASGQFRNGLLTMVVPKRVR